MKSVAFFHFSPTGSSEKIGRKLSQGFGLPIETFDLVMREFSAPEVDSEVVSVFAAPVYGGRIPSPMVEAIKSLQGNGSPAVLIAVYGNRAFEDALVEMSDVVKEAGFKPIAAAACVAKHSLAPEVAANRPTKEDLEGIFATGKRIFNKLLGEDFSEPQLPGNRPYREYKSGGIVPEVNASICFGCGCCIINCPTDAINPKKPIEIDPTKCIQCGRCIKLCPSRARNFPAKFREMIQARLAPIANVHKENEFFL